MKKSRPGTLICTLCREQDREALASTMLRHTTIGVRETTRRRYVMVRSVQTAETPYGAVRQKVSQGYGVTRSKGAMYPAGKRDPPYRQHHGDPIDVRVIAATNVNIQEQIA